MFLSCYRRNNVHVVLQREERPCRVTGGRRFTSCYRGKNVHVVFQKEECSCRVTERRTSLSCYRGKQVHVVLQREECSCRVTEGRMFMSCYRGKDVPVVLRRYRGKKVNARSGNRTHSHSIPNQAQYLLAILISELALVHVPALAPGFPVFQFPRHRRLHTPSFSFRHLPPNYQIYLRH